MGMSPHHPTPPPGQDGPGDRPDDVPPVVDFTIDLTSQEMLRRSLVMAALGSDWDPVEVLRGEEAAYDLLYSGLDDEQQRVYEDLVAAGVLPRRGGGHAAA
ncbi:DUF6400 family protein [Streptomyces sp. NPDC001568]|uniref:DUF6400 family protein n=1 Tax=Streptomyces sp. NPDC001568 TaxID=3364588 RepID=UPI00368D11F1